MKTSPKTLRNAITIGALPMVIGLTLLLYGGKITAAGPGDASEGQKIFKKNCNMCHFPDKADKKMGPGLKDLFKNKELPASKKPATEDTVREQIAKGSKKGMPPFEDKLSASDVDNLIAYLKTL